MHAFLVGENFYLPLSLHTVGSITLFKSLIILAINHFFLLQLILLRVVLETKKKSGATFFFMHYIIIKYASYGCQIKLSIIAFICIYMNVLEAEKK